MYDVGQVLYVVLQKKQKIIPVQVVEEIVRRTVTGEKKQYLVRVPGRKEHVDMADLGDQIYADVNAVKEALKRNLSAAIDAMAERATEVAVGTFGLEHQPDDIPKEQDSVTLEFPESLQVQLENGKMANVRMPKVELPKGQ